MFTVQNRTWIFFALKIYWTHVSDSELSQPSRRSLLNRARKLRTEKKQQQIAKNLNGNKFEIHSFIWKSEFHYRPKENKLTNKIKVKKFPPSNIFFKNTAVVLDYSSLFCNYFTIYGKFVIFFLQKSNLMFIKNI